MKNKERSEQELFTRLPQKLMRSKTLDLGEKVLISYILGWQKNNKECTASNPTIAFELGISESTLKRMINKLNKTSFFISSKFTSITERGGHLNRKKMVVDEELLNNYLNESVEKNQPIKIMNMKFEKVVYVPENNRFTKEQAFKFLDEVFERKILYRITDDSTANHLALQLRTAIMEDRYNSIENKIDVCEWITLFKSEKITPVVSAMEEHKNRTK